MSSAYETIIRRRSIKKYKPEKLSEELLDLILTAGTYAPTASNKQSPLIVAITNKEDRDTVAELNKMGNEERPDPFYGAPAVVVVFAEKGNPNGVQDASLVMANLMHAANALGVGSSWINRAKEVFELPEGKALMRKWGIDEDKWVGVGNCILGYSDAEPKAGPRKENYIVKVR